MSNEEHYFNRGRIPHATASSLPISSSKYLDSPALREWVSLHMLRRNGRDVPCTYDIPRLVEILLGLQDRERIEAMFTKARKSWPELDRWFEERHVSTYTRDDLARHPEGSLGNALYRYLTDWDFELEWGTHTHFEGQYGYFMLRAGQQHDVEHLLGGGGYDMLGEWVPNYMRLASFFKFFEPALAKELFLLQHFLNTTAASRIFLHYPETYAGMLERQQAGMRVGELSGPFFLQKYEDYFDLPIREARERIGMAGVVDRDTTALSDICMEGVLSDQFGGKAIPNVMASLVA